MSGFAVKKPTVDDWLRSASHHRYLRLRAKVNCDSVGFMRRANRLDPVGRHTTSQNAALVVLLIVGGLAIAGPSGLLSWSENLRLLDQRKAQLTAVQVERAALANKVELLDPAQADPDMVGELLRSQLNVVHPDEVVIKLDD